MLPDTLKTFLDQCKQQNLPFEGVVVQLTQSGWNAEQIESARKYYVPTAIPPVVIPPIVTPPPVPSSVPATPSMPAVTVISAKGQKQQASGTGEPKRKGGGLKVIVFVLFGLVFLALATSVPAYFIAAGKLNIGSQAFKDSVTNAVFSIPFIPKTPKFVLTGAVNAHKKILKNSFDVSVAAQSSDFTGLIGANNMDAQVKGYADFSDTKNPRFSVTANITKDFSAEARKNDKMIYLKINKVPPYVTAMLGVETEKLSEILQNWIAIDSSPLETEARKNLDSIDKPTTTSNESVNQILTKLLNEQVLPQLKMTNEKLDKFSTYKLVFAPNAQVLDKIASELDREASRSATVKLSSFLKDLVVSVWVDSGSYYVRKGTMSFTLTPSSDTGSASYLSMWPLPMSANSPVTVSAALLLSDFGSTKPVEVPGESMPPEDFYQKVINSSSTAGRQISQSNNAKRRSDIMTILSAITAYSADNKGVVPTSIGLTEKNISKTGTDLCGLLVGEYLAAMPADPAKDITGGIKTCSEDYDTGYTILKSKTGNLITISAPGAELDEVISVTR